MCLHFRIPLRSNILLRAHPLIAESNMSRENWDSLPKGTVIPDLQAEKLDASKSANASDEKFSEDKPVEHTLKRQLKARHISMIRCVEYMQFRR